MITHGTDKKQSSVLKSISKMTFLPAVTLFILFVILNIFITRRFLTSGFMIGFFTANAPLVLIAIGVSVVLIGGGIDISLGAITCLVNVVFISLVGNGWSFGSAAIVGLVIALVCGVINGIIVGFFRVPPLLATFATTSVFGGIALWIMPTPGGSAPMGLINWYNSLFLGLPAPIFIIVAALLIWVAIKYSPIRIWLYSMGRDEKKAYMSAVPVKWTQLFMYSFSGLLAGIGALCLTGSIGSGDPLAGLPLALSAIAACVIGGISLSGGKGSILGSVFGALFLGLVITTVLSAKINPFYQDFFSGVIILVGVIGATLLSRKFMNKA
ncbi:MAG: ABC transporter permease [Bacillota bacterium]|nr:ABC transporter permease [Bacillota bacterium]